ncbi:MAG: hypothetical protein ACTHM0_15540 [Sphingomonas sp.]
MRNDIIDQMRAEEADLVKKLNAVRAFIIAYGEGDGAPREKAEPMRKATTSARGKVGIEGYSRYGQVVVAEAMRVLIASSSLVRTRQLVEAVEAMGIEISGENKINALGALLSRSEDIISHGKSGWELSDRDAAKEIVAKYGHKENEPHSETAGGSDAGNGNAPTYPKPWESPQSFRAG